MSAEETKRLHEAIAACDAMELDVAYLVERGDVGALQVLQRTAARLALGCRQYGRFDVSKDPRDFREETIQELLDAVVYLQADKLKREALGEKG